MVDKDNLPAWEDQNDGDYRFDADAEVADRMRGDEVGSVRSLNPGQRRKKQGKEETLNVINGPMAELSLALSQHTGESRFKTGLKATRLFMLEQAEWEEAHDASEAKKKLPLKRLAEDIYETSIAPMRTLLIDDTTWKIMKIVGVTYTAFREERGKGYRGEREKHVAARFTKSDGGSFTSGELVYHGAVGNADKVFDKLSDEKSKEVTGAMSSVAGQLGALIPQKFDGVHDKELSAPFQQALSYDVGVMIGDEVNRLYKEAKSEGRLVTDEEGKWTGEIKGVEISTFKKTEDGKLFYPEGQKAAVFTGEDGIQRAERKLNPKTKKMEPVVVNIGKPGMEELKEGPKGGPKGVTIDLSKKEDMIMLTNSMFRGNFILKEPEKSKAPEKTAKKIEKLFEQAGITPEQLLLLLGLQNNQEVSEDGKEIFTTYEGEDGEPIKTSQPMEELLSDIEENSPEQFNRINKYINDATQFNNWKNLEDNLHWLEKDMEFLDSRGIDGESIKHAAGIKGDGVIDPQRLQLVDENGDSIRKLSDKESFEVFRVVEEYIALDEEYTAFKLFDRLTSDYSGESSQAIKAMNDILDEEEHVQKTIKSVGLTEKGVLAVKEHSDDLKDDLITLDQISDCRELISLIISAGLKNRAKELDNNIEYLKSKDGVEMNDEVLKDFIGIDEDGSIDVKNLQLAGSDGSIRNLSEQEKAALHKKVELLTIAEKFEDIIDEHDGDVDKSLEMLNKELEEHPSENIKAFAFKDNMLAVVLQSEETHDEVILLDAIGDRREFLAIMKSADKNSKQRMNDSLKDIGVSSIEIGDPDKKNKPPPPEKDHGIG